MPDKADIRTYTYAGPQLKEISFPVGGIGAGCIGLAGNGALHFDEEVTVAGRLVLTGTQERL